MAQLGRYEDGTDGTLSGIAYWWMGTVGPLKLEVVNLTTPSAEDYFYTKMANPKGLLARPTTDAGGATDAALVSLSGRKVTMAATLAGGIDIGIIIFGY